MNWVPTERAALAEAFAASDPTAPTLCEGWNAGRLLAHLVMRERSLFGTVADLASQRPPGREKHLSRLAGTTATSQGYAALIQRFADGPPRWSPMSWAGEALNLTEYVIHHEDLRRGTGVLPAPRELPREEGQAILKRLPLFARMAYRRTPVEVALVTADGDRLVVKKGTDRVEIVGTPVELALYVSGRQRAADVQLNGTRHAVDAFLASADPHAAQ